MKKLIVLIMALFVVGCSSDSSDNGPSIIELTVEDSDVISSKRVQGEITTVGEVDRYFVNLAETGRNVQIKCTNETLRPDVELLVNVFEENAQGDMVMVAGDHARDTDLTANIKVNVYVDAPKKLYINVRDLMDDNSSYNNPYFISASYEAAPDGNGSFETAVSLTMDGTEARDVIGSEDDADCFSIQAAHDGVYDVYVDFDRQVGSGVKLQIQIFNEDGELIEARNQGTATKSHMIHFLEAGNYYVLVNDQGKDDFDNLSYYEVSVDEFVGAEAMANDTPATATVPGATGFSGSIDYFEDLDTYAVDAAVVGNIKVMDLGFSSDIPLDFLVELHETIGDTTTVAFSHEYTGGDSGDGIYQATLKLDNAGTYNLVVRPTAGANVATLCPYAVTMDVTGITDADEDGDGNNVESDAIDLSAEPSHAGKVSYRGDADWYTVTFALNPTNQQVLSLFLDVPASDQVQYAMKITSAVDQSLEKIVFNSLSDQRDVDLQTGLLVPMGTGNVTYAIKVYDFQNDNGDKDAVFTLDWNVSSVPGAPVACPKDGGTTVYHNENDEGGLAGSVTIEYPDNSRGTFKVDTDTFALASNDPSPVTIQSPWISGYIDYQGDEDWFSMDLNEPLAPIDGPWHYTINVELYAPGSPVEYTWEYMPDSNGDHIVSTEWCRNVTQDCFEGVQAAYSDSDISEMGATTGMNTVDYTLKTDESGYLLWLRGEGAASVWDGTVFFRISDFNYLRTAEDTTNSNPDNDWGFVAPYYFRVTVTYYNVAPASPLIP
ncbi:MAG: hypothetical protein KKD44_07130 [Proteobacteria bacterium]|nr:hypothetical protein [Pseudomonadota bacterium]